MDSSDFKYPLNTRVALKQECADFYPRAIPDMQGIVAGHRYDNQGFPMILVEWDKDHWRYNDEANAWTFESHFSVVEEPIEIGEDDYFPEGPVAIAEPCEECGHVHDEELSEYMEQLMEAVDAASEGEGFLMIAVKSFQNPDDPNEILMHPTVHSFVQSASASHLVQWQIAKLMQERVDPKSVQLVNQNLINRSDDESGRS